MGAGRLDWAIQFRGPQPDNPSRRIRADHSELDPRRRSDESGRPLSRAARTINAMPTGLQRTQPGGLADGSRWSFGERKGANDHRNRSLRSQCIPEECQKVTEGMIAL